MTSMITSSGVRPTPAFAIPSTRNTAPVLEYRCLYTHDLRRKQKRWQDGLLRFHTFNKRIMVYDASRNYIGDMHWRENEILQDGDEFELDRGVLIQVGEATGSMEQDLTGLFEKKKKVPEVAVYEEIPHEPVAVPMARPTAAQPSQLRPKTLNALLGTPKGRIGRAALPTKSPHELRIEGENISCNQDRPAKRQRIESQLERQARTNKTLPPREPSNVQDPDVGMNRRFVGAVVDKNSEENPIPTTVRTSGLPNAVGSVNMLPPPRGSSRRNDREDEAFEGILEPLRKNRSSASGNSDMAVQQKQKSDQNSQVSLKAIKITNRPDHELETGYPSTSTITKPIEIASDEDATRTDQPPNQRLKLQIASRKPRKKLMYQELLPQESSTTDRSPSNATVLDRGSHDRSTSGKSEKREKVPMTDFHKEEQDRLRTRLNRHRAKEIQRDTERETFCGDAPEDLFLSQESIDTVSAKYYRTKEKDPGGRVPKTSMTGSRCRNTESVLPSTRRSPSQEAPQQAMPRPTSSVHRTAVALAKMDEMLFPRAQPRISESVGDKDFLTDMSSQDSSPTSIAKTSPNRVSTPAAPKPWPISSPAFQTQNHLPSLQDIPREEVHILSRSKPDSPSAFVKSVQIKVQAAKRRKLASPPSDSNPPSIAPPPLPPINSVSAPSPLKEHPLSAPGLQTEPGIQPNEAPTPQPPTALLPPIPNADPTSLLAFSKIVAPKPAPAPNSVPRRNPENKPAFTKVTPIIPVPTYPDDNETVEVPSSQPPSPPPPDPPPKEKRKPDPQLPAFTKVIPTKPPRSGLRKSRSDTSATMQQAPSALPVSGGMENPGGRDESAGLLWNKEAWDLFGCGRDGVECTYEEFKRKEGLM